MKKPNFLAGIIMFFCLSYPFLNGTFAQQTNVPLADQMDYVIAPLNFTEVTSGLLLDRGLPMMEIAAFDGSNNADTLLNFGDWLRQYGTLLTANLGNHDHAQIQPYNNVSNN